MAYIRNVWEQKFISPENENVEFIAGFFPDSVPEHLPDSVPEHLHSEMFAFVHLDADLYDPIFGVYPGFPTNLPSISCWHNDLHSHANTGFIPSVDWCRQKEEAPVSNLTLLYKYSNTAPESYENHPFIYAKPN